MSSFLNTSYIWNIVSYILVSMPDILVSVQCKSAYPSVTCFEGRVDVLVSMEFIDYMEVDTLQ